MIREVQRLIDRTRSLFAAGRPSNRRLMERVPVDAVTIVTAGGMRQAAEMRDVSPDGAKIVTAQRLLPETRVEIELADLAAPVSARVVHTVGMEAGVRFDVPGSGLAIAGWAKGRYGSGRMTGRTAAGQARP